MTTERLCTTPNQHARPPGLELTANSATFRGYQEFVLTRHGLRVLPADETLAHKHAVLDRVFRPSLLKGRTVLDLGANSAFFSFLALQNGAVGATAVDIDKAYIENVARAARALGFDTLATESRNVADWREPADVVVALALVHWLYTCTAAFGSMTSVVEHLATLAREALIVEWVDADDPAIQFFGHLDWNGAERSGPYDQRLFERELSARFEHVELLGDISPTRRLILVSHHPAVAGLPSRAQPFPRHIDSTCPLPLLHPADTVISCSRLTVHDGREYWSRVYDLGACMRKQTTGALATREARVLERLCDPAVPRVLDVSESHDTSTVTLEKIAGQSFDDAAADIAASAALFRTFLEAFLDLLASLRRAQVAHRDIHKDNLLVREGRPVLIDFGWATAPDLPIFTPDGFGPRSGSSDVHAAGCLLQSLCSSSWPAYGVVTLMANDDPALRVEDPDLLRRLLDGPAHTPSATAHALLALIVRQDHAIRALREQQVLAARDARADRRTLADTELALAHAERTIAYPELVFPQRTAAEDVAQLHARLAASPAYGLAYASSLRERGEPLAALAVTTRLLSGLSENDDFTSWLVATYLRGSLYRDLGRPDEALGAFNRILASDSPMPASVRGGACYHSALVLEGQGARDAARARLEQCLAYVQDHAAARAALARLLTSTDPRADRGHPRST
jgi:tetratricopeptide (TPR) repeat protein/SAM-dependent methyltransferase